MKLLALVVLPLLIGNVSAFLFQVSHHMISRSVRIEKDTEIFFRKTHAEREISFKRKQVCATSLIETSVIQKCLQQEKVILSRCVSTYKRQRTVRRNFLKLRKWIDAAFRQFSFLSFSHTWLGVQNYPYLHTVLLETTILSKWSMQVEIGKCVFQRFLAGIYYRKAVTFRGYLLGLKGLMESSTRIAVSLIRGFATLHSGHVSVNYRTLFLNFLLNTQTLYQTYSTYILNLQIGHLHFNGGLYLQYWNNLHNLVTSFIQGQTSIHIFIAKLQFYQTSLNVLQTFIQNIATAFRQKLLVMQNYRMQMQALFFFYSRVYFLCMVRQSVIGGEPIHSATYITMQHTIEYFYKTISIFIIPPKHNPQEHDKVPPLPEPMPTPRPTPTPPPTQGETGIEFEVKIDFNGKIRILNLQTVKPFMKEVFAHVKKSMSALLLSVMEGQENSLTKVVQHSQQVAGNMHIMVTIYTFIRQNQKTDELFALYNEFKNDLIAALDFVQQAVMNKMDEVGPGSPLVKKAGESFQNTLVLHDMLCTAMEGNVEDKLTFNAEYDRIFKENDTRLLMMIRLGLKKKGDERAGVRLLAPIYTLSVMQKLSRQAWKDVKPIKK